MSQSKREKHLINCRHLITLTVNSHTLSLFSSVKMKFRAISIRFHLSASLNWDWRYSCLATTLFSFLRSACKIATSISATPLNGRHTVNRFMFLMSNTDDSKLDIIKSILNCSLKYFSIFALISSRNCLSFTKLKRAGKKWLSVSKNVVWCGCLLVYIKVRFFFVSFDHFLDSHESEREDIGDFSGRL